MSGKYAQGRSLSVWRIRYATSLLSTLIFVLFTIEIIGLQYNAPGQSTCPGGIVERGDATFIIFPKEENHEGKFPWFTCNNLSHAEHF